MDEGRVAIDALKQACRSALDQLGSRGSFRLRALIGMLPHEINLEAERIRKRERPPD